MNTQISSLRTRATARWIGAALALVVSFGAMAQGRYDDERYDERDYDGPPPPSALQDENISYGYADVLRVDPIYDVVRTSRPREECYDERVVRRDSRGDNTGGTILGAVIGGALGNQVGKGDGRRAATVAGAVVGGAIGHDVDKRNGGDSYATTERRCRLVDAGGYEQRRVAGYDVEYRFRGEVYVSRLNYNPGDKLRVRVAVAPAD